MVIFRRFVHALLYQEGPPAPPLMVYAPVLTLLSVIPAAYAIASMVVVLLTAIGVPVTKGVPTVAVGVVTPSIVYRIDAPAVVVLKLTCCVVL
jgi:hypothetical protein